MVWWTSVRKEVVEEEQVLAVRGALRRVRLTDVRREVVVVELAARGALRRVWLTEDAALRRQLRIDAVRCPVQ